MLKSKKMKKLEELLNWFNESVDKQLSLSETHWNIYRKGEISSSDLSTLEKYKINDLAWEWHDTLETRIVSEYSHACSDMRYAAIKIRDLVDPGRNPKNIEYLVATPELKKLSEGLRSSEEWERAISYAPKELPLDRIGEWKNFNM